MPSPPYRLRLLKDALADLREARDWWALHRDKAPTRPRNDLREAFAQLRHAPHTGRRTASLSHEGVRRLVLRGSRLTLYYVVQEQDVIVLRVDHASRRTPPPL